ncbi:head-tail adaptor protein [Falsochrobactrum shanghaiense]|uniref:Head-tail adaptor protein n=1 Tax=Falsochrobactrum shanghaiense TaxID=2201899 RepID=A0A316JC27_9HYPH|nr:head-tail adaptor protein [Falsochrobactrum shanghaiense]PWL18828.1 head-tail adaptor protein [Falsochrobactrum shanghaiense]
MATRSAGPLRGLVHCQDWVEGDDGWGGTKLGFETKATVAASFLPLRGSEAVMASRLAGKQPYVVTIRSSEATRVITPAWRLVDARAGNNARGEPKRVFDIKAISDPDGKNAWLEVLCEEVVT